MELFACRLACGGWEGWEGGQTERAGQSKDREEQSGGNVGATHIETHFHESVEDRLSPMLCQWTQSFHRASTELPVLERFFRPPTHSSGHIQVSPPAFHHALQHLCPSVLRNVTDEPERL